jgi:hypothetical protein
VSNHQWAQKVLQAAESGDSGSFCHQAGGKLEQIQFLLGHVSVQTTELYLDGKRRFHNAVKDWIGLEPDKPESS